MYVLDPTPAIVKAIFPAIVLHFPQTKLLIFYKIYLLRKSVQQLFGCEKKGFDHAPQKSNSKNKFF